MIAKRNMSWTTLLAVAFALLGGAGAWAVSLEVERVDPFLAKHCFECHDELSSEGGLDLESVGPDLKEAENFEVWAEVFRRVESGEMPPKKKERPGEAEKSAFLEHLGRPLMKADLEDKAAKGRVNVRRLTRREYEYTMHDLLGVDLPLADHLPEDVVTHGFETVASGQPFSHFNMEAYLEAADLALEEAFGRVTDGDQAFSRVVPAARLGRAGHRGGNYRGPETRDGVSIAWPIRLQFYGRMPATTVPASGWYRVTLKDVHAVNPRNGVVWGSLRSGVGASNAPVMHMIGSVEATAERRDLTYEAWIEKGHLLEMKPNDAALKVAPTGARGGNVSFKGRDLVKQGYSGIGMTAVELERIYPNAERREVQQRLFGGLGKDEVKRLIEAGKLETLLKKAVRGFASRAFRRPVDDAMVARYVALGMAEVDKGKRPKEGLRAAYRAVLCSPRFLTLVEVPGKLDAHAVASRLSTMLWNTMPDAALRKVADDGSLLAPEVLAAQVERLLADGRSERFVESFTDQWLNLKEIDFTAPDRRRFRSFDPVVQASMVAETRAFFGEMVRDDLSVTHVIDSEFAVLNERLARFYGMKEVELKPGRGLQRVALKEEGDRLRGGLVTQGAVLKVTANGTTTSPVVRGVFVGERLLGLHIPPPPANVPAVEPDIRGAVSIRDQLEKHRDSASCAACHQKIDPAGFALESFDPVGLWRSRYGTSSNSAKVDPSGVTPEGQAFGGIWGWKKIYRGRPEVLAEAFATQLMTYATGAVPRFSDREAIAEIVADAAQQGYGVRRILHGVVASEAFLTK